MHDDVEFGRAFALKYLRRLLPGGVDFDEIQANCFFSDTTIEVDDVVLDLNGHEMARAPALLRVRGAQVCGSLPDHATWKTYVVDSLQTYALPDDVWSFGAPIPHRDIVRDGLKSPACSVSANEGELFVLGGQDDHTNATRNIYKYTTTAPHHEPCHVDYGAADCKHKNPLCNCSAEGACYRLELDGNTKNHVSVMCTAGQD